MRLFTTIIGCIILAETYGQTSLEGSFVFDGELRSYRVYIPAVYNRGGPVPLLLNLHGYGSSNVEQQLYSNFTPIADTAGFIMVLPNGTTDLAGRRFWNTFGGATVDDVGFIASLIDTISSRYSIDRNRIYSTGMSNGGFMSYELACSLSHRIAAIASVTGSMIWSKYYNCQPLRPVPVMQIHGTADGTVTYTGNILFVHIDSLVAKWVRMNSCSTPPTVIPIPDINKTDNCTAERHIYTGGRNSSSVEFFKVFGGGHSWPGAPININVTCMDFNASAEIWRFLRTFRLDRHTTNNDFDISPKQPKVFPNPSQGSVSIRLAASGAAAVSVYNPVGQLIMSLQTKEQTVVINLVSNGLHLIQVHQNGKSFNTLLYNY